MFFREFSVLKVKSAVRQSFEFPLSLDECAASPFAGVFSEGQLKAMDRAVGHLPFAQRTHDGRRAWSISAKRGELDVWFTSDGSVFVEGVTSLNVVYALFLQLLEVCPDLALEDRITGELHDRHSLLRLVRRDEHKASARLTVAAALAAA
ncbi:MAG: hypothetical protein Q8S33_35050 [Myxococcales bacterium]|nr:hypothetical protein [Myxococcales bacterium]MDP3505613.1 hypothetical protein [Myxococcales bacterium]